MAAVSPAGPDPTMMTSRVSMVPRLRPGIPSGARVHSRVRAYSAGDHIGVGLSRAVVDQDHAGLTGNGAGCNEGRTGCDAVASARGAARGHIRLERRLAQRCGSVGGLTRLRSKRFRVRALVPRVV